MSRTSKALLRLGVPGLAAVTLVAGIPAFLGTAQAAPINSLTIAPVDGGDSGAAGSCQAYVITGQAAATNTSTVGETVNVVLTDALGSSTSDVSFCTAPTTVNSTTVTPAAGTVVSSGGPQTGGGSTDQARFTLGAGTTANPNNGQVVIGLTRNQATAPGTAVNIQAYSDQNGNNTFNAGEPQANRTTVFTAGGPAGSNANQDAVSQVEVIDGGETATSTPDNDADTALAGEQRSFTVGTSNGTDPVAGVTVSYSINSSVDSGDRGTAVFGVTNNDGTVTGNITFPAAATDVVTFFVNQSGASSTPNLDGGEPSDQITVTVASNAGQQNRAVALTALADAESTFNSQSGNNAVNATTDGDRTFRATVTDTRSSGASASTAGTLLSFAVTGGTGDETVTVSNTTPGGFTNECTTVDEPGTTTVTNDSFCDVTINDPSPDNGETLTVTATVRGTSATGAGTLRFRAVPNAARNIAVTPDSGETVTEGVRTFSALVTDVNNRPVEGVVVNWTETGAGFIRQASGSSTTGANGVATIETTASRNETGEQTVTGTIAQYQADATGTTPTTGAGNTQCGSAAGTPAGSTAGNCSDTGKTTWVTSLTPSPSASASASASPSPSATSTVSPSPSATTQAPRLGISVSPATITPGVASVVTVTGRPGTIVELQAYSRPSTTYTVVRRGTILENGTVVFRVVPGTNTRLFAAVTGQTGNESPSVVINVRTALSLTVVRNGSLDYTFQGRILPRRAGQLITLYRVLDDGREIITSQIKTDNTGTYRIRRVFVGQGTFGFLTRTGQTLTNAAGVSNNGNARPTSIYAGPQR